MDTVRRLALTLPVDPLSYSVLQLRSDEAGDVDAANRAAMKAITFQPRSRAARMHMVNELIAAQQFDAALDQISLMARLDRRGEALYAQAVLGIAEQDAAHPAIVRAVAKNPPWKQLVLRSIAEATTDLDFLQALFEHWPEEQRLVLERLVDDGQTDTAYLNFLSTLPAEAAITTPFDPSFNGLDGSRPFNWEIDTRYAEISEDGGLLITYFGRGQARLARQIFPIEPVGYELTFQADGTFEDTAAQFELLLECVGRATLIAQIPVKSADLGGNGLSASFEVETDLCDFGQLSFWGRPGEFPRTTRLTISNIALNTAVTVAEDLRP